MKLPLRPLRQLHFRTTSVEISELLSKMLSMRKIPHQVLNTHYVSPHHLQTSTIGDELKISSNGSAIVWGIAATSESAILSVGHAANGVMYIDNNSGQWRSSTYYNASFPEWLKAYSTLHPVQSPALFDTTLQVGSPPILCPKL